MGYYEFRPANWHEYRAVLAMTLDAGQFETVSQAVSVMIEVFEKFPKSPAWPADQGYMDLKPQTVATFGRIQAEAAAAFNALAGLSGQKLVSGDRIHAAGDIP